MSLHQTLCYNCMFPFKILCSANLCHEILRISKHCSKSNKYFHQSTIRQVKRRYPVLPETMKNLPVFQYPVSKETDRRVYVWGLAEHGALGNHNQVKKSKSIKRFFFRPIRLHFGENHKVTDVTCGYGFTVYAVSSKDKNKVYGCGINTDSQLGCQVFRKNNPLGLVVSPLPIDIPFKNPETVKVNQIAGGRAHLLILTDSEGVYSLGNNAYGQCGRRIIENEDYATSSIIHNIPHLDGHKIEKVECGQDHSIFITDTGCVYSCGWGADGQTGSGQYINSIHPTKVIGDIEGENIVKVACSVDTVLALNDKGEIFGWGNTEYGQLTSDGGNVQQNCSIFLTKTRSLGKFVDIAAGGSFCIALNDAGEVYVWGYGILGKGPKVESTVDPTLIPATLFGKNEFDPETKVMSVSAGLGHMAAITNTGNLYTWGKNRGGCLGLGEEEDQYFPLRVAVGAYVKKISCGVDHMVAICKPFV